MTSNPNEKEGVEKLTKLENMMASRIEDLDAEIEKYKEALRFAKEALNSIANADYRGNRSSESQEAFHALTKINSLLTP